MNEEKSKGEWFNTLPRTDKIYRLIELVQVGASKESRIQAIRSLGESGDPRAVRPLTACSNDGDPEIRRNATDALVKLSSVRGVIALGGRLTDSREEEDTRKLAAKGLAAIGSYSAIELLIAILVDRKENEYLRTHVAAMLGTSRAKSAIQALQSCLSDESPGVRVAAGNALLTLEIPNHSGRSPNGTIPVQR